MHLVKQSFLCAALALAVLGCSKAKHTHASSAATASTATETKPAANVSSITSPGTHELFDGKTLAGWISTDFSGRGQVSVKNGELILGEGYMTGVTWTSAAPRMNYEVSLDAKRTEGSDFFCGLTFAVKDEYCSFIVGGWGGSTVGISSVDSEDASQNETSTQMNFVNGKWYHIRVRVTPGKIGCWIDEEQVVKLDTEDRRLSTRLEMDASKPIGIATWNTGAALKNIKVTVLE